MTIRTESIRTIWQAMNLISKRELTKKVFRNIKPALTVICCQSLIQAEIRSEAMAAELMKEIQ